MADARTIHVLYENSAWLPPVEEGLRAEGLAYELHEVLSGCIDIATPPPPGIWLNRMSPSSHTRGHDTSVALMRETLAWLEGHGARVVNGLRAYELEMSKLRQDMALRRYGIESPRTMLTVGRSQLLEAAATFEGAFITKHNQGGKGLGIQLFDSVTALAGRVDQPDWDWGPHGQMLVQQYIQPKEPYITRVEIVGEQMLYAMRSSTVGGFELCPADACQVPPPSTAPEVCPADGDAKFTVSPLTADDPLVAKYIALCAGEGIELAGIEFVEDADGRRYTYDINGTTNYNSGVGEAAGVQGMHIVARYLKDLLQ